MEERLTLQELLYWSNHTTFSDQLDNNEQAVSTFKYTGVTVLELKKEIARKTDHPHSSLYKSQLPQLLYNRRQKERLNGTINSAPNLIPRLETQMPICNDSLKKGSRDMYLVVDEVYHRDVVGKSSGKPGKKVVKAMNRGAPELSRIHAISDFVNIVFN